MSKTLLRGLGLIEQVGLHGPLTVTELARLAGVEMTIVSRTVKACEQEGWLARVDGKIGVGPRSALVGLSSPVSQMVRQVEPIVHAISGICGVATAATGLIGGDVMVLASAGTGVEPFSTGGASRAPIHVMAAGRAIAAHRSESDLNDALLPEPFPGADLVVESLAGAASIRAFLADRGGVMPPAGGVPTTRVELEAQLELIRADGFARDHGELHPSVNCIAAPWPGLALPASLSCFATRDAIEAKRSLIEVCLSAGTKPGASAQDVIRAAAVSA